MGVEHSPAQREGETDSGDRNPAECAGTEGIMFTVPAWTETNVAGSPWDGKKSRRITAAL